MTQEIVGRGWAFPPRVNKQRKIALTNERSELDQAMQIILSTAPGERVMRPTFGCRLQELVFAPCNSQTAAQAQRFVREALGMWEPRITVQNVSTRAAPDSRNCLLVEIEYEVKATHDRRSLIYPFYLIPQE